METSVEVPQKAEISLGDAPAMPLLGTYSEGSISHCRANCSSVVNAALLTTPEHGNSLTALAFLQVPATIGRGNK